jgi:hypothetical protein
MQINTIIAQLLDMNTKYMVMVAAMAAILAGATAFATDSAFADGKKKYGKSQVITQANECGNGKLSMYVFCENIGSQVQGDKNAPALDGAQNGGEDRRDKKDGDHDKAW